MSLITFCILVSLNSNAQGTFSIHAGPSFPLADFGDDDIYDDDSGLAAVGITLGGNYLYKLNNKGLGLNIGLNFKFNGLKSRAKDDVEEIIEDGFGEDVDIKFYKYINIPIIGGINYTYKASEQISLVGNIGIGPDFMKVTNLTVEVDNEEAVSSHDLSTQLAYKIGGGLLLNDKFIISLDYYGLGKHRLKGEVKYENDPSEELEDLKLKVSLLTLTFGIKL